MNKEVTIIIPFYNVEEYFAICLESIVTQEGFEKAKVLLIDDGSSDNSSTIAQEYSENYDNIIHLNKPNGGQASARNFGLDLLDTQFVTFCDSDDIIPPNALNEMLASIKENDADIVIGNIQVFPRKKASYGPWRSLFGKGNYFINNIDDYPNLYFSPSPCNKIFKSTLFNEVRFKEGIHFEDAYTILPLLMSAKKIYLIDKVVYMYRKREDLTSTMDNIYSRRENYFDHLIVNEHLVEEAKKYRSIQRMNNVSRFVLRNYNAFMLRINSETFFSDDEKVDIFNRLTKLYRNFDYSCFSEHATNNKIRIMYHAIINNDFKLFSKSVLEGVNELTIRNNHLSFEHNLKGIIPPYLDKCSHQTFRCEIVKILKDKIIIEGQFRFPSLKISNNFLNNYFLKVSAENQEKLFSLTQLRRYDLEKLFEENSEKNGFKVEIALSDLRRFNNSKLTFSIVYILNHQQYELPLNIQKTVYRNKGWVNTDYGTILLDIKHSKDDMYMYMYSNNLNLNYKKLKYSAKKLRKIPERIVYYKYHNRLKDKNIWLIAERNNTAQDNSYALFEYLRINHPEIEAYYLIDKDSLEYEKVKKLGNVIERNTEQHLAYLLHAKVWINSYDLDSYLIPSKYSKFNFYKLFGDLINPKRVFLQHGVTYNDVTIPLHKNRTDYDMILTSSIREENYISEKLNYNEDEVFNVGLPRFDKLVTGKSSNNEKIKILFMPTWRQYLSSKSYLKTSVDNEKLAESLFLKSVYYYNLNGLINSERLASFLERNNAELLFYPHYESQQFIKFFDTNSSNIKILSGANKDLTVQSLLISSDVLITDYSSVFFDFAYMNKPIVHFQFDLNDFYSNHYKPGYFNFEQDGFGPIVENVDSLMNVLDELNNNNWLNPIKYSNKVSDFFGNVLNNRQVRKNITEKIKTITKDVE